MKKDQCIKPGDGEPIGDILARLMAKVRTAPPEPDADPPKFEADDQAEVRRPSADRTAVYDFDLAEFPLFSFAKRPARDRTAPLVYADTIRGKDGRPVTRTWTASPGRLGLGGATAHALLFDLLQMYAEQGGQASVIHFGTLRSLYLRRGERNPSKTDYDRLRRDFAVLRGYDFSCRNAFWDARRRAYVDMDWRLFGAVRYFKADPGATDGELPHGQIELSPTFRAALQARGQFRLGFRPDLFHRLPPLAQRLAVYLAKMFTYQAVHRRRVEDLARLLPIEATTPSDVRKVLRRAATRLLATGLPVLAGFACAATRDGRWWATFRRGLVRPKVVSPTVVTSHAAFSDAQVERIVAAVDGVKNRAWWSLCVRRLGPHAADRALGQLREAREAGVVRNPGGLLTKIFMDIAAEHRIELRLQFKPHG